MKFGFLIEPPFNFRDADRVTGCDVELAKHIVKQLGLDPFEPIETEFSELIPGLNNNQWDMSTGMFSTKERQEHALFSRPIWALPDGLLVQKGNPKNINGYKSIANTTSLKLAVIRDQIQHQTALQLGVSSDQIEIFETYPDAANAVSAGTMDAYASVDRAHIGFIEQSRSSDLQSITVQADEKPPAFGCFAFAKDNNHLQTQINLVLNDYLGSANHIKMMSGFGFSAAEVELVLNQNHLG